MSPQRQDYLLRLIEELGRFVREVLRSGEKPRAEAALPALVQAQERLFALPAEVFLGRPLEVQVDLLAKGESSETTADKCITYAGILHHAAELYTALGRPALALSSRQVATQVVQIACARWPEQADKIAAESAAFTELQM